MSDPVPRPGKRHVSATEINLASTEPPPAPDRRPPPVELATARKQLPSIRDQTLAELAEQAREARAEAEAANAALARVKLEAAAKEQPERFDAVAYFTRFQVIALKILLPLAAVAAAVGVTLGIYSKTAIEPKVDRTVEAQVVQKSKTVTVEERVKRLEQYNRDLLAWADCMSAIRDSAIERGTGHHIDTDHAAVEWTEQNAPQPRARVLWKTAPWSVSREQACSTKPAPPSTPLASVSAP